MIDREKVIKGLECCQLDVNKCLDCPYFDKQDKVAECGIELHRDAIALLKAREPIEARLNLCESCTKEYAECEADKTDLVYGSGVGNDNIIGCPWYANRWKVQEPRVMMLEEVAALPDGSIVWLEDNDKPDVIVGLLRDVLLTANDHIVMAIHFATVKNQLLEVVTAMADDYGIRWRCWTSRPDEKRRAETPWDC